MNTCKTCLHWTVTKPYEDGWQYLISPIDIDTCEPMQFPFEVRRCRAPKLLFCERPIEPDGAAVADGSTYMAALITGPDFGCTNWRNL